MNNKNIQIEDSKLTCFLQGRLDTAASEAFSQESLPLLLDNIDKKIIIDCTKLDFISSSGLRILLKLCKASQAKGKTVTVKNLKSDLMDVLHITNMDTIFHFE